MYIKNTYIYMYIDIYMCFITFLDNFIIIQIETYQLNTQKKKQLWMKEKRGHSYIINLSVNFNYGFTGHFLRIYLFNNVYKM